MRFLYKAEIFFHVYKTFLVSKKTNETKKFLDSFPFSCLFNLQVLTLRPAKYWLVCPFLQVEAVVSPENHIFLFLIIFSFILIYHQVTALLIRNQPRRPSNQNYQQSTQWSTTLSSVVLILTHLVTTDDTNQMLLPPSYLTSAHKVWNISFSDNISTSPFPPSVRL